MDALWSDMDARCMGRLKIPVSPNAAGAVTAAAAPTDCAPGPARTSSRQTVETRALDLRAVSGLLRAGSLADREFLTPGRNAEDLGVEVFSPNAAMLAATGTVAAAADGACGKSTAFASATVLA